MTLELWKPMRVGDYWQCATPTGPYNFRTADEVAAIAWAQKERAHYEKHESSRMGKAQFVLLDVPEAS